MWGRCDTAPKDKEPLVFSNILAIHKTSNSSFMLCFEQFSSKSRFAESLRKPAKILSSAWISFTVPSLWWRSTATIFPFQREIVLRSELWTVTLPSRYRIRPPIVKLGGCPGDKGRGQNSVNLWFAFCWQIAAMPEFDLRRTANVSEDFCLIRSGENLIVGGASTALLLLLFVVGLQHDKRELRRWRRFSDVSDLLRTSISTVEHRFSSCWMCLLGIIADMIKYDEVAFREGCRGDSLFYVNWASF